MVPEALLETTPGLNSYIYPTLVFRKDGVGQPSSTALASGSTQNGKSYGGGLGTRLEIRLSCQCPVV